MPSKRPAMLTTRGRGGVLPSLRRAGRLFRSHRNSKVVFSICSHRNLCRSDQHRQQCLRHLCRHCHEHHGPRHHHRRHRHPNRDHSHLSIITMSMFVAIGIISIITITRVMVNHRRYPQHQPQVCRLLWRTLVHKIYFRTTWHPTSRPKSKRRFGQRWQRELRRLRFLLCCKRTGTKRVSLGAISRHFVGLSEGRHTSAELKRPVAGSAFTVAAMSSAWMPQGASSSRKRKVHAGRAGSYLWVQAASNGHNARSMHAQCTLNARCNARYNARSQKCRGNAISCINVKEE